jgi:hypothetical protein
MTKNRILGCLRVPPGVRVPPVENHCSKEVRIKEMPRWVIWIHNIRCVITNAVEIY